MLHFFYQGGPLFMGILTLVLIAVFVVGILEFRHLTNSPEEYRGKRIQSFGLLALVIGVLGQLIGLYSAFTAMEASGDISQSVIAGGLKVSMITTLYGMLIFLFSLILKLILDWRSRMI